MEPVAPDFHALSEEFSELNDNEVKLRDTKTRIPTSRTVKRCLAK